MTPDEQDQMWQETRDAAYMSDARIPVRCKNCQRMHYVPGYCFISGLWYGDVRKTLNFSCQCGWKEKIIL